MSSEARRKAISQRTQQHTPQYGTGKSKSAFPVLVLAGRL